MTRDLAPLTTAEFHESQVNPSRAAYRAPFTHGKFPHILRAPAENARPLDSIIASRTVSGLRPMLPFHRSRRRHQSNVFRGSHGQAHARSNKTRAGALHPCW